MPQIISFFSILFKNALLLDLVADNSTGVNNMFLLKVVVGTERAELSLTIILADVLKRREEKTCPSNSHFLKRSAVTGRVTPYLHV